MSKEDFVIRHFLFDIRSPIELSAVGWVKPIKKKYYRSINALMGLR